MAEKVTVKARIATLSAENAQLKAQVAERDEALRPFLSGATNWAAWGDESGVSDDYPSISFVVTMRDCRRLAALQPKAEARHD